MSDSKPSSASAPPSTSRYFKNREGVVAYVAAVLNLESGLRSITITKPATYAGFFVSCATGGYSAPEAPTSSSKQQPMSVTRLPAE